jgi:hypothetical protein
LRRRAFAPIPDENYQLDTSATPTDTDAVAAVKLLFQGKVDFAKEATNLRHFQSEVTATQLWAMDQDTMAPKSDPRNDAAVNFMLERILKHTPVPV